MRGALLIFPLLLVGCASPYHPVPLRITDQDQYAADVKFCTDKDTLAKYQPSLDIRDIGAGALSGAGDSATGGVVGGALVVGIGAAGGATHALADGLDAFGKTKPTISRNCVYDTTMQDHSAILARPED